MFYSSNAHMCDVRTAATGTANQLMTVRASWVEAIACMHGMQAGDEAETLPRRHAGMERDACFVCCGCWDVNGAQQQCRRSHGQRSCEHHGGSPRRPHRSLAVSRFRQG